MSKWYSAITSNPSDFTHLANAIHFFQTELEEAKGEIVIKGSLEKLSSYLPGIVEHRFNQLQEIEAILKYLNIKLDRIRGNLYKKYLEQYNRDLKARDIEKYIDADDEVLNYALLINEVALIRNYYLGIIKALEAKSFQINNIVKLRTSGLDDTEIQFN